MTRYIHEQDDWPNFRWNTQELIHQLAEVRHRQGRLIGRMKGLGFRHRSEAMLISLTSEVVKTGEIEGERLDHNHVRSSIARRLGIDIGALTVADRHTEGMVDMVLDATQNYDSPMTLERLSRWHAALFPDGRSGMTRIRAGLLRDDANGPMVVVSGPIGRQRVHFQAPSADRLPAEIDSFLKWYNEDDRMDLALKAGVAHLWFVTIHPLEDGNGRIARAIADQTLTLSESGAQRYYSMSSQIRKERSAYYNILERTQKGDMDITRWLSWFLECLMSAIDGAGAALHLVLQKARFWEIHSHKPFNERQRAILNRLMDDFQGALTTTKYAKLAKCSQDTALRDIDHMIRLNVLQKNPGGGRSTSYSLLLPD